MTWRARVLDRGGNAAAPAVRLRGLFLPPAARAGPSRPLCGLASRSGGFPRPSFASLRAGRVIPPPPDRPCFAAFPGPAPPWAEIDDPSTPSVHFYYGKTATDRTSPGTHLSDQTPPH